MKNKKMKLVALFLSQIILLIILISTNEIFYVTHDDTVMIDIVSGGYGPLSEYVINMHILIGWLLKGLFHALPGINWVTILYLFIYLISFLTLDFVFFDKPRYGLIFVVIDTAFLIMVSHFSFTIVAYAAVIAGVLSVIKGINIAKMGNCYFVMGIVLVFLGGLIRGEVIKSILVILVFYILCDWKNWKRHICTMTIYLIIMYVCINSNLYLEKLNPVEKTFLEWGETRSNTLDCTPVPYDEEVFSAKNISIEQYKFLYSAFYFDYKHISKETLETLASLNTPRNKYNFDIIGFLIQAMHSMNRDNIFKFSNLHNLMFYFLMILYIILCIKKKTLEEWKGLVIWLSCLAVGFVFYFIQRGLYRVIMPNYILLVLLLLWMVSEIPACVEKKGVQRAGIVLSIAALIGTMWMRFCNYDIVSKDSYSKERQYVLDYMTETNDIIYLAGDPGTFSVAIARPIFEYTAQKGNWTLMGDWEIYSVPYYNLMKEYDVKNVDNLLLESINSATVRYITLFGDDFISYNAYVLDHLEKVYGITAHFEKETDIIIQADGRKWSVYRLTY